MAKRAAGVMECPPYRVRESWAFLIDESKYRAGPVHGETLEGGKCSRGCADLTHGMAFVPVPFTLWRGSGERRIEPGFDGAPHSDDWLRGLGPPYEMREREWLLVELILILRSGLRTIPMETENHETICLTTGKPTKKEPKMLVPQQFEFNIREEFFPYNASECNAWHARDCTVINGLVDRSGPLGRSRETYLNQPRANYFEVRFAVNLVEQHGYPKDFLVYENYTLSYLNVNRSRGKPGLRAEGIRRLGSRMSGQFFEAFDRLCDLNGRADLTAEKLRNSHLDLYGINPSKKHVTFIEVKTYRPGTYRTEAVTQHQKCLLAFISHILRTQGEACFLEPGWSASAKLVAFVEQTDFDCQRIEPQSHSLSYFA